MAMQLVDKLIRRTVKTTNYILTESSKQRRIFEQKDIDAIDICIAIT